jgi:hypothetical protein
MSETMERSPSVFLKAEEEEIRDILLVSLNASYAGEATAETFSAQGKTDIYISVEGKSIFIAELKFWRGQQNLTEALDQLLSYLTWRKTKTALIILNRNKDFGRTLSQIRPTAEKHKCFKRFLSMEGETIYRYAFANQNDANREVFLTILAFDIPTDNAVDA